MRKIVQGTGYHNAGRLAVLLATAALALMGGCGETEKTVAEPPCPVAVDATSWEMFDDMANRLKAGSPLAAGEVEDYMALPGMSLWRRSLTSFPPSDENMGKWLNAAFGEAPPTHGKVNPNRRMMVRSFRYSHDRREIVSDFIREFEQSEACRLDSLARYWIDPDKLPAPGISVHFMTGTSEVRIENDSLVVDTGLLIAVGPEQVARQLTALLYRNHQIIPGENPAMHQGAEAVIQTWRVVTNEGLAAWIEQITATEFRSDHPRLGDVTIIPEVIFSKAVRAVGQANIILAEALADSAGMEARGRTMTNWFIGQNAFGAVGFAMSATIVAHLGADRLREVGGSMSDYLAAYQEAALLNPAPQPVPGEFGSELHESMPPLQPEVFEGLHALLAGAESK